MGSSRRLASVIEKMTADRKTRLRMALGILLVFLAPGILYLLAHAFGASRRTANGFLELYLPMVPVMAAMAFFTRIIFGHGMPTTNRENIGGANIQPLEAIQEREGVPIGKARMPTRAEPLHTLIEGATGTGKTQLLKQMVQYIRDRGDTVVIVDTNFDMFQTFGQPDDIILSAFDPRSPGWSPANEIEAPTDWNALAETLIEPGEGNSKEWNAMARAFFAAVARGYHRTVQDAGEPFDFTELAHLLTAAPPEEVEPFLIGSAAASLSQNEKGMNNIRMSFYESLAFVQDLKPGDFSVRQWVAQGKDGRSRPSIFIPHTKRTISASRTLIATWIDQIVNEACDQGENSENRVWIIIDELSSLGRIPALETAVTELRKTGFRVIAGIQNYEQIEQRYSKTGAATISNNLSNKVIFRANAETVAERQSRLIGDSRVLVHNRTGSTSSGKNGTSDSTSWSVSEQVERAILPSEILSLPDLAAIVKFGGEATTYTTHIPVFQSKNAEGSR